MSQFDERTPVFTDFNTRVMAFNKSSATIKRFLIKLRLYENVLLNVINKTCFIGRTIIGL